MGGEDFILKNKVLLNMTNKEDIDNFEEECGNYVLKHTSVMIIIKALNTYIHTLKTGKQILGVQHRIVDAEQVRKIFQ